MSINANANDKNVKKCVEIAQKKHFTLSQKSCYRKWVNKVGDLKTCTEKLNIMNEKIFKQAQRRAAGDRSERKYSKKYLFISKHMTFGPLGHVLTLLNGPQIHIF